MLHTTFNDRFLISLRDILCSILKFVFRFVLRLFLSPFFINNHTHAWTHISQMKKQDAKKMAAVFESILTSSLATAEYKCASIIEFFESFLLGESMSIEYLNSICIEVWVLSIKDDLYRSLSVECSKLIYIDEFTCYTPFHGLFFMSLPLFMDFFHVFASLLDFFQVVAFTAAISHWSWRVSDSE